MFSKTNWHTIQGRPLYEEIAQLQQELVMAYRLNDMKQVYRKKN